VDTPVLEPRALVLRGNVCPSVGHSSPTAPIARWGCFTAVHDTAESWPL
jgi:hypothetical protein